MSGFLDEFVRHIVNKWCVEKSRSILSRIPGLGNLLPWYVSGIKFEKCKLAWTVFGERYYQLVPCDTTKPGESSQLGPVFFIVPFFKVSFRPVGRLDRFRHQVRSSPY